MSVLLAALNTSAAATLLKLSTGACLSCQLSTRKHQDWYTDTGKWALASTLVQFVRIGLDSCKYTSGRAKHERNGAVVGGIGVRVVSARVFPRRERRASLCERLVGGDVTIWPDHLIARGVWA